MHDMFSLTPMAERIRRSGSRPSRPGELERRELKGDGDGDGDGAAILYFYAGGRLRQRAVGWITHA
jgi:hypothetical protein